MRLPKLSGEELISRLRERRPSLKVLAISDYPLHAPVDVPFLAKPFTRDAVMKAIQDVLSTPQGW